MGGTSGLITQIFVVTRYRHSEETGVVDQVNDSSLSAIITEQLRDGNLTDRLQRVWDIIRHEKLHVKYCKPRFPIISGNHSLSQELIARARLYFETTMREEDDSYRACTFSFIRHMLAGRGASTTPPVVISVWLNDDANCITGAEVINPARCNLT